MQAHRAVVLKSAICITAVSGVSEDTGNKKIEKIRQELSGNFCRRCEYCMPCPNNVNIPQNFLLEGYYTRYNLKEWALERYESLGNAKASECIECGTCETKCPYNLPIINMLKNACEKLENK